MAANKTAMYIPDELYKKMMRCRPPIVKVVMWLIGNANENGTIDVTYRTLAADVGITVREARTALSWCVGDTLCDTASDTRMTHVTIRNIECYRQCPHTNDTASDTVSDTPKDKETEKDKSSSLFPEPLNSTQKEKDKEKENLHTKGACTREVKPADVLPETKSKRFVPPTVEEVRAYIQEKGYNVDAEQWWNFYNAKNWMIGKNKMVKWKSAVATWNKQPQYQTQPNTAAHRTEEIGQIYRQSETKYTKGW